MGPSGASVRLCSIRKRGCRSVKERERGISGRCVCKHGGVGKVKSWSGPIEVNTFVEGKLEKGNDEDEDVALRGSKSE